MNRFAAERDTFKDPRIFENPIEASIELADITQHRLPSLKRRNIQMAWFAAVWTITVMVLTVLVGILSISLWVQQSWDIYTIIILLSLSALLVPSIGLGIALLVMTFQEKMFLPYLEHSSKAVVALSGPPSGQHGAEKDAASEVGDVPDEGDNIPGGSIGGILGSAMWVGDMVPVAGRLTAIARGVVAVIIAGLVYLIVIALAGLLSGLFFISAVVAEIVVFALFVGPAMLMFQALSRDREFYHYYRKRHSALGEISGLGIPPVPKGETYLERFDRFLMALPYVKNMGRSEGGGVDKHPGKGGFEFSRFYHGAHEGVNTGILVKEHATVPTIQELVKLVVEANAFGQKRGIAISRVVALVATDAEDLDDKVYDHIIETGHRTGPGECALQLVMEVEGTYSMVPYVSM